ncbi:phage portal protein [Enterobacter sp. CP102]|uniref:phage portal protein n=1 Tax=Enterobacter sp. CP102 TaxID=2976431 RepID=UPI0021FF6D1F|nr:phage portal protein [Enterobacter sp. CP102]UWM66650.1 phage portal protein [Enterobacter sp. CP102]
MELTDKVIKDLVKRRHPEYDKKKEHWDFISATYAGGRAWFDDNVFRYFKEGDQEYKERVERAYRFNHTREVVNLINKYIFREDFHRTEEDAPEFIRDFWRRATRQNVSVNEFMAAIDLQSSIYGRIWVVVDSTMEAGAESVEDQKKQDGRAYAYWISPQQMLDLAWDDDGNLLWALVVEVARDDADPFASTGQEFQRYRLWTQNEWYLFREEVKKGGQRGNAKVYLEDSGEHNLGVVPVFPVDCIGQSESPYFSPSLIDDIAYLDRAVANYLSNLDAIIQDQTFSQLAIPVQAMLPGDENHGKVLEMGTKRVFTFDGEGGSQPFYMSPDPKQAQMIITTVQTVINEIYHSVGVAGERTKQDNAKGIDNSSGAAKAYDFQRVNSLLVTKAERLERAERQMLALVGKWMGEELEDDHTLVSYPESFDIRGLTDEFAVAQQLSELQAPESVRRYQMEMLIDKIFPNVTEKMKKEFEADLLKFPPKNVSVGIENSLSTTYDKASSQETEKTSSQGSGNSSAQATER